jgi:hypothetical protein
MEGILQFLGLLVRITVTEGVEVPAVLSGQTSLKGPKVQQLRPPGASYIKHSINALTPGL